MAGGLPADLVEQTALTLSSVSKVTLPAERWPAVERALSVVDRAVDTDDADALGYALDELHRIGLSPPIADDDYPYGASSVIDPPPMPSMGYPPEAGGAPPSMDYPPQPAGAPPAMGHPAPSAPRSIRRWIWLGGGIVAVAMLLAFAVLGLMTSAHNTAGPPPTGPRTWTPPPTGPQTGAPSPILTHTWAPPPTGPHTWAPSSPGSASPTAVSPTDTPTQAGGGVGIFIAIGLLAVAVVVIGVVIVLMRRRSRKVYPLPSHLVDAAGPIARPERLAATFAPNELVELANRTVDRLVDKGGRR
jgi:hypothetical protein